jgi:cytochrome c-type biogenesis protein CcmH/NrfG
MLQRNPSHGGALFLLGTTRARLNDLSGALPLFEKLTELDPGHGNG